MNIYHRFFRQWIRLTALSLIGLFIPATLFAGEGVFVANKNPSDKRLQLMEQYVQQIVINSLIRTYAEIFERTMKSQKLNLIPQMVYLASQQATLASLKQPDLRDLIREAFTVGLDVAQEELDRGTRNSLIEAMVSENVDYALRPIKDMREFRFITEEMLRQALIKQQQILLEYAYQQQVQKIIIEQKLMTEAIQKQYDQMVASSILK